MAIRFDAVGDRFFRISDLLDYGSAYTVCFWLRLSVDMDAYVNFFSLNDDSDDNIDYLGTISDGTTLQLYVATGGSAASQNGTNLSVGTWYHVSIVRESLTVAKFYVNGILDGTVTKDVTGRTSVTRMDVALAHSSANYQFNGLVADVKAWSSALTIEELKNEMWTVLPRRFANIYGFWPCFSGAIRLKDYSGNGRDWTAGGTLTDESSPPVSWGMQSFNFYPASSPIVSVVPQRALLGAGL